MQLHISLTFPPSMNCWRSWVYRSKLIIKICTKGLFEKAQCFSIWTLFEIGIVRTVFHSSGERYLRKVSVRENSVNHTYLVLAHRKDVTIGYRDSKLLYEWRPDVCRTNDTAILISKTKNESQVHSYHNNQRNYGSYQGWSR